jgi:hypothetical protein
MRLECFRVNSQGYQNHSEKRRESTESRKDAIRILRIEISYYDLSPLKVTIKWKRGNYMEEAPRRPAFENAAIMFKEISTRNPLRVCRAIPTVQSIGGSCEDNYPTWNLSDAKITSTATRNIVVQDPPDPKTRVHAPPSSENVVVQQ